MGIKQQNLWKSGKKYSWSNEETQWFKDNYPEKVTLKEAAIYLGRSYGSLSEKARRMGLKARSRDDYKIHKKFPRKPEEFWAYMAGIMDGEGTYTLNVKKVKGKPYIQAKANFCGTSPQLFEWVNQDKEFFSIYTNVNNSGTWYFIFNVKSGYLKDFLENVRRYSVFKKDQIDLVLKYISIRDKYPLRFTITDEMWDILNELRKCHSPRLSKSENAAWKVNARNKNSCTTLQQNPTTISQME